MNRLLVILVLTLALPYAAAAQHTATPPLPDDESPSAASGATVPAALVGRWRSAPFQLPLSSDLDESVYGRNASAVRTTELTIDRSGQGTLRVTHAIHDRRGQPVLGTRSEESVRFTVAEGTSDGDDHPRIVVKTTTAERRYLDPPKITTALDGLQIALYLSPGTASRLDMQVEMPGGEGSFSETLRRVAAAAKPAAR